MNELRVLGSEELEKKSYNKKHKKRIFSVFMFFTPIIIVYLFVVVFMSFSNSYSLYTITRGEYEDTLTVEGYIFREQSVINASSDGFLDCRKSENERVPVGVEIASIYDKMPDTEVISALRKIDQEISKLNSGEIRKTSYTDDTTVSERNYADEIKSAVTYGYAKDFTNINDIAESIILDKRKDKLANANSENAEITKNVDELLISQLESERASLISSIGIESESIVSNTAGVFSSKIDGLEELLLPSKLEGITPSYLKNLPETNKMITKNVEKSKPVCKIINNFEWYYSAIIPTESATSLSVNQTVKLRFFDITNNTVLGTITYISPDESGETVVVIKSNKYVDSIYTLSKTNANIIKKTYTGLKIPADGIRVSDNQTGVYVLRQGFAKFVNVDVMYTDGKWAIVKEASENSDSHLKLYDELIYNARNMYDGKPIN